MIKINIPGMHAGVSQQSPTLRLPNQHESAVNVLFDPLWGARAPRWGTQLLASGLPELGHVIGILDTTDGKQWLVSHDGDQFLMVDTADGTVETLADTTDYTGSEPYGLPVLDTMIVLNRDKVVLPVVTEDSYNDYPVGLVYVPQVFDQLGWNVKARVVATKTTGLFTAGELMSSIVSSGVATTETPTELTHKIREKLTGGFLIATDAKYGMRVTGSIVLHSGEHFICKESHTSSAATEPGVGADWSDVWFDFSLGYEEGATGAQEWTTSADYRGRDDILAAKPEILIESSSDFSVRVYSGILAPNGINYVVSTDSYENLPPSLDGEFVVWFIGGAEAEKTVFQVSEGYYVRYDPTKVSYVECAAPGETVGISKDTMPHQLGYNPDTGVWTYGPVDDYDEYPRQVGDSKSAPLPDFVGKKINNVFFYRNRLGVLSQNYLALSQVGRFYDWFPDTATEVLDSDPIIAFPTSTKFHELRWAIPFNKQLVLMSDTKQYVVHSGYEALSSQTVAVDEATGYILSKTMEPLQLESSIILPRDKGQWVDIMEYKVPEGEIATEANKLSTSVPNFVTNGSHMTYLPAEHIVVFWNPGSDIVMILKTTKKEDGAYVQIAWSTWEMPSPLSYLGAISADTLLLVYEGGTMSIMDTGANLLALDNQSSYSGYEAGDEPTKEANQLMFDQETLKLVLPEELDGPRDVTFGDLIPASLGLSPIILRDDNGLPRADVGSTTESIHLDWRGGDFRMTKSGMGLPSVTQSFTPLSYTMEVLEMQNEVEPKPCRFLVMAPSTRVVLELSTDSPVPVYWNNLSYSLDVFQDWG